MQIYITRAGEQSGPYSQEQIEHMLRSQSVWLTDLAWHQGLSDWQPLHQILNIELPAQTAPPPLPIAAGVVRSQDSAVFLYVPLTRLVLLSILTGGVYDLYWIYHNWRFLMRRDRLDIRPFWRTVFCYFYVNALFNEMNADHVASRIRKATFSPGGLAAGWIILTLISNVMSRSDNPGVGLAAFAVGMLSCIFLLPVQTYVNEVNEALPNRPAYYRWSTGHIICIVLGVLMWLGILTQIAELAGVKFEE